MSPLLNPTGFVYGDVAVALISSLAAAFAYMRIACTTPLVYDPPLLRWVWRAARFSITGDNIPRWMIALGWTLIAVRLWHSLAVHGDAPVAPISLIALSMIGGGAVLLQIKKGAN